MRYQLPCKRALLPNLLEEAAGSSYELPVLVSNEVSAALVQAGASTGLPVLTANEAPTPAVQAGAGTKRPGLTADEISTPVQAGIGTEFSIEDASALSQLPALTANEVRAASMQAGASIKMSAGALPGADIIHGQPEPVVVGPLQQVPFFTVNEFVLLDPGPPVLSICSS
jgi:hypothetical protein